METGKTDNGIDVAKISAMFEKEQKLYVKQFMEGAPATGPNSNMQERSLARALLAWLRLVAQGDSQVLRMAGIGPEDLDVDSLTFDEFFEGYLEECRNYGFALEESRLRSIAKSAWRQIMDPPTTFDNIEKEKEFMLDRLMTVEGPWLLGNHSSILNLSEMAVSSWIRDLQRGDSICLSSQGTTWDRNSYSMDDYVNDVAMLANRYKARVPEEDIRAHARIAWDRLQKSLNGMSGPRAETREAPPVSWAEKDIVAFTERIVTAYGYEGVRAEDTLYYLPKLLKGEMTPEQFVADWRARDTAKGGH